MINSVRFLLLCLMILFFESQAQVQVQVDFESPYKEVVHFPGCTSQGVCGLHSFQFLYQDYKITYSPQEVSYGTRMFAEYSTKELSQVEDFGIVQFVKGCQFQSRETLSGIEYIYNILRDFFGERVVFIHRDWQVDSVDKDLMYNNTPPEFMEEWGTRHGLYRWNQKEGSYEPSTEILYYKERPMTPRVYVVDRPGTSFVTNGLAKNISLQFKTCIFPTKDIPIEGDPRALIYENAIHCFSWGSSFIYDHSRKSFSKSSQLHSACQ